MIVGSLSTHIIYLATGVPTGRQELLAPSEVDPVELDDIDSEKASSSRHSRYLYQA